MCPRLIGVLLFRIVLGKNDCFVLCGISSTAQGFLY
jgi:hypothetical protein